MRYVQLLWTSVGQLTNETQKSRCNITGIVCKKREYCLIHGPSDEDVLNGQRLARLYSHALRLDAHPHLCHQFPSRNSLGAWSGDVRRADERQARQIRIANGSHESSETPVIIVA